MPIMAKRTRRQLTASDQAQRWLLWTATAIITCIAFEALAVTTAMPTVTRELEGEHLFALANGIALAAQLITTALAGQWVDAKGVKPALFIGLSMFSAAGCEALRAAYQQAWQGDPEAPFHESANLREAKLTDLLQELIATGQPVQAVDIYKGWMEVDTLEDYERVKASLQPD